MANNVVRLHSPWQLAADASDRIAEIITEIPGWDGYEYSGETQNELRQVVALLQQAIPLLEQACEREERAVAASGASEKSARREKPSGSMDESVRTGRPPRLSRADEWQLYCYRKSGIAIKTCASMFRVSVPTANRIIARFKHHDDEIEPVARAFRKRLTTLRDSVSSAATKQAGALITPDEEAAP